MKSLYNKNQEAATTTSRTTPKYDEKYGKNAEASFAGVFFFIIPILFTAFCLLTSVKYDGYDTFITVAGVGALVLRVITTIWVERVSKELNRNSVQWMALAFFLPGTALTLIGQKKRLFDPSEWKQHLYNHNRSITIAKDTYTQAQRSLQLAS